ncbi:MAG TPA: transposase [Polyangiaceae bacterium]|jgi:putative transposase|nr:transposase [Polyangiaceae bacterium]
MLVRKAFRYRVYPTPAQEARLLAWEGALRFLWNVALEQRRMGLRRVREERVFLTAFDQINELKDVRAQLPWLADVPRNVCAQLLVELDKAWQRCFKKLSQPPRWKRKGRDFLGLTEPHPKVWRLDGKVLRFPKLGNLKTVLHRPLEGSPKSCTVRREGDQWFASILCELEVAEPAPKTEPVVALDRGLRNLLADSDGTLVPNPAYLERALKRLARAQRVVSRRQKGSRKRQKAIDRVNRLHRKIRRQREHSLHTLSSTYAKSHGTVVVERLQIRNMVRANSGLARRILGSGWGLLVEMLHYKLAWQGGRLIEVPAAHSSQTCSACGHIDARSRSAERFHCTACGHVDHADLNAAKVLKSRANRSALPLEGSLPEGARRTGKVVLRVPRRPPSSVL